MPPFNELGQMFTSNPSSTPAHFPSSGTTSEIELISRPPSLAPNAPSALKSLVAIPPDAEAARTPTRPNSPDSPVTVGDLSAHPRIDNANSRSFELPPVDTGKAAWMYLAAAFVVEMLVWGFPFAFGIFQEYYSNLEEFRGKRGIAVIGTCAMGLIYLSAPLVFGLLQSFPHTRRPAILVGLVVMCLALGLSSLSQTVGHLIATQGVLYAVGGSLVYSPTILFMDEWFVRRKGLAFGVMWAGTGLGGVLIPLLLSHFLSTYGFRTTLRIWTIVLFISTFPLLHFLRPRVPVPRHTTLRRFDLTFLLSPPFLLLQTGNILEALGYFIPSIYLPSYARALGATQNVAALSITVLNVSSVFGCVGMGVGIDRWHVSTCILLSTLGSSLSVFFLWGFANRLVLVFVFAACYGVFAGGFSSTYPGVMMAVQRKLAAPDSFSDAYGTPTGNSDGEGRGRAKVVDTGMGIAFLGAGRGVGNVVCGPLSELLIGKGVGVGGAGGVAAYQGGYGALVVFTGVSAALGGVSVVGRRVGWL